MTRDDIPRERVDALMDGATPETESERALVAMAARMRSETAPASADLRHRVDALGRRPTRHRRPRTGRVATAPAIASALAVVVAATVLVGAITQRSGSGGVSAQSAADAMTRVSTAAVESQATGSGASPAAEADSFSSGRTGATKALASVGARWSLPRAQIPRAIERLRAVTRARGVAIVVRGSDVRTISVPLPPTGADTLVTDIVAALGELGANADGPAPTISPGRPALLITLRPAAEGP